MSRMEGEQTLMRIFISENDRWERKPLYEVLVELFRNEGLAGATVLKGAAGFGARSVTHTDKILRLSTELPIVIEVVDSQEKINLVLPKIDGMFSSGMITMEKAHVICYRGDE